MRGSAMLWGRLWAGWMHGTTPIPGGTHYPQPIAKCTHTGRSHTLPAALNYETVFWPRAAAAPTPAPGSRGFQGPRSGLSLPFPSCLAFLLYMCICESSCSFCLPFRCQLQHALCVCVCVCASMMTSFHSLLKRIFTFYTLTGSVLGEEFPEKSLPDAFLIN